MTKRRDRNRTARRRRRVYRFYWSHTEEHAVARIIAAGEFKSRHQHAALKAILTAQKTGDIAYLGIAGINLYGWAGEQ